VAFALTPITASQWSSVTSSGGVMRWIPALLTSTSSRPNVSSVHAMSRSRSAASITSTARGSARHPSARISLATVPVRAQIRDDHIDAVARQAHGKGRADAVRRAGHDSRLPVYARCYHHTSFDPALSAS